MKPEQVQRADEIVRERIHTRKPLAYLLGEAWLSGQRFKVDERVIVPRSFIAELLPGAMNAEVLEPWVDPAGMRRVLDLCTGSGCFAILAAKAYREARVDAIDISPDALAVARENIKLHRMDKRVRAIQSDLLASVEPPKLKAPRRYDLILCNPPYVDAPSMRALPDEYRKEPELALAGGKDGLDLVRKILRAARDHLTPNGVVVMEIGHNRRALERAYPRTPFMWLETSAGEDMVFLLTARDLPS